MNSRFHSLDVSQCFSLVQLCDEMGNVEIDIAENLVDALFEQTDFEIQNILR